MVHWLKNIIRKKKNPKNNNIKKKGESYNVNKVDQCNTGHRQNHFVNNNHTSGIYAIKIVQNAHFFLYLTNKIHIFISLKKNFKNYKKTEPIWN